MSVCVFVCVCECVCVCDWVCARESVRVIERVGVYVCLLCVVTLSACLVCVCVRETACVCVFALCRTINFALVGLCVCEKER